MDSCHLFLLVRVFFFALFSSHLYALSPTKAASTNRHICLFDSYSMVQGPHFTALFDQLLEQTGHSSGDKGFTIAVCALEEDSKSVENRLLPLLEKDFVGCPSCHLIVLEDYNPLTLQDKINDIDPSVIWVADAGNAFAMRYRMRTSGLDTLISESLCDTLATSPARLYVGEGSGAICGGASMAVAHLREDDPKAVPEPQFFGLGLLGPKRSILFSDDEYAVKQDTKTIVCKDTITTLRTDQVLVWSQTTDQESTTATTFVMTPCKKGTIENFETLPPLPPLGKASNTHGGVPCEGERAIDPSRTMQQIGDSEWLEEFDR